MTTVFHVQLHFMLEVFRSWAHWLNFFGQRLGAVPHIQSVSDSTIFVYSSACIGEKHSRDNKFWLVCIKTQSNMFVCFCFAWYEKNGALSN